MNLDFVNWRKIVEKMAVTFLEAALGYVVVNGWNINNKTALAGLVGAGLSAVYNFLKQYNASNN